MWVYDRLRTSPGLAQLVLVCQQSAPTFLLGDLGPPWSLTERAHLVSFVRRAEAGCESEVWEVSLP